MLTSGMFRSRRLQVALLLICSFMVLTPTTKSYGIVFLCDAYDSFDKWWNKREKLQKDALDPNSGMTPQEFNDTKEELDEEIEEFAEETIDDLKKAPGTSLTGPPSWSDLKDMLKDAVKDLLGFISLRTHGGVSDPKALTTAEPGVFVASPAFESIPVDADDDEFEFDVEYSYVANEDETAATLVMECTFSGITFDEYTIYSNFEESAAYDGLTVTPEDIEELLEENPSYARNVFARGFFSEDTLDWVADQEYEFDPDGKLQPGIEQISIVDIEVDSDGNVSGSFTCFAADLPNDGTFQFETYVAAPGDPMVAVVSYPRGEPINELDIVVTFDDDVLTLIDAEAALDTEEAFGYTGYDDGTNGQVTLSAFNEIPTDVVVEGLLHFYLYFEVNDDAEYGETILGIDSDSFAANADGDPLDIGGTRGVVRILPVDFEAPTFDLSEIEWDAKTETLTGFDGAIDDNSIDVVEDYVELTVSLIAPGIGIVDSVDVEVDSDGAFVAEGLEIENDALSVLLTAIDGRGNRAFTFAAVGTFDDEYSLTELGQGLEDGYFVDLSEAGHFGGWVIENGTGIPSVRYGGELQSFSSGFDATAFASGVSNNGELVGFELGTTNSGFIVFGQDLDHGVEFFDTLGGDHSVAYGIDPEAQFVVGYSTEEAGYATWLPTLWKVDPIEGTVGEPIELPTYSNIGGSAVDCNRYGQAVGSYSDTFGNTYAVRWSPLSNDSDTYRYDILTSGWANAITDSGVVVGTRENSDGSQQGFVWIDGVLQTLEGPEGCEDCDTAAISANNHGEVVGYVWVSATEAHPTYWNLATGEVLDLEDAFGGENGVTLRSADTINDAGMILAAGYVDDYPRTFLLSPDGDRDTDLDDNEIPDAFEEPVFARADANEDGLVGLTDALTILLRMFADGAPLTCEDSGDTNDDGRLSLVDPILILNHLYNDGELPESTECGTDPTEDELECQSSETCL